MGNVMGALLSGFGDIVGKLFGHPLDFLSGKACRYVKFFILIFRKLLLTPRHNRRRRRHQKDIEEALVDISSLNKYTFDEFERNITHVRGNYEFVIFSEEWGINVMGALLSGFGDIVGKLFGHPLDFLSGKACSWEFASAFVTYFVELLGPVSPLAFQP
ncbi:hypothetical protein MTR67_047353 [Solanum verrucosum]|uniref:Uncharacterized protein n=1 Tax=Solanum verrucosum TaxID=315347 RepID=A0AAF0UZA5_SOLVR|nr:hypothetical protein MTR67_047353 [Solanum verrucosum]